MLTDGDAWQRGGESTGRSGAPGLLDMLPGLYLSPAREGDTSGREAARVLGRRAGCPIAVGLLSDAKLGSSKGTFPRARTGRCGAADVGSSLLLLIISFCWALSKLHLAPSKTWFDPAFWWHSRDSCC